MEKLKEKRIELILHCLMKIEIELLLLRINQIMQKTNLNSSIAIIRDWKKKKLQLSKYAISIKIQINTPISLIMKKKKRS